MIIVLLWVLAFIVPAFTFGFPVPHAPYVLVPALAVSIGLSDPHALRRVLLWIGLVLLYELVYHVPVGMLAGPVAIMSVAHVVSSRVIRMESASRTRTSFSALLRAVTGATIWVVGLIGLSTAWGALLYDMGGLSWTSLYAVWGYHGVSISVGVGVLVVVLVLRVNQVRQVKTIFSDHVIIQTYNVSD